MTDRSHIFEEDLEWISNADLPWEQLRDSNILITGATGLIGMTAVHALICAARKRGLGLHIYAVVRDPGKAEKIFGDLTGDGILDGRDASAMLTYYAKTSTGYKGTIEDFMAELAAKK